MSTPINDGGPAFPTQGYDSPNHGWQYGANGMSLRDWLAGQATNDDIEEHLSIAMSGHPGGESRPFTREQAKYRYADAMIAAREGKATA